MKDINFVKDSTLLKEAFRFACDQMKDFVTTGINGKNDFAQLRACISTISAYTRLRAVENSESMIKLSVARVMSGNTKELKGEIKRTLPEYVNK
jgi:hypothetical protein